MNHLKISVIVLITFLSGLALAEPAPTPLTPQAADGEVGYITARLLEEFHYSQHPLDTEMSEKFYDAYLDAYDPQHLYFLQSDIAEFAPYRTNLDGLTLGSHGQADVAPAYKVYDRFMERLQERVDYVNELLKHDNFKFTSNEKVQIDRKDAPYPTSLAEAKHIWREQLLFDFLKLKLDKEDAPGATLSATNLAEIAQTLQQRYEREYRFYSQWDGSDVLQAYLDSLAHAYDPHSDYLNHGHAQDFGIQMSLALFGIGAGLTSDADGYCEIDSLIPGGPAEKSDQLKKGDKIIAVAQGKKASVDVVNMELSKIVQLIRGPKGTQVRLTIIPVSDPKTHRVITLTRDEINLKDEGSKASLIEMPNNNGGTSRLGVIDVPSFYAPVDSTGGAPQTTNYVSSDVGQLITKLKKENVDGIILDLRGNPGGSLEEAVQFVGLFVTNGPVVQIHSPDAAPLVEGNDNAPDIYKGPLIVLVNRFSASASEIVAAALQDYGRALIVGDTSTFGKGSVQNLDPLRPFVWASESATNDPGLVKITIRKFYRINGASTQLKGVVPDIILPDILSYSKDMGESSLPNAMPWDTIPATNYVTVNDVQPYLTQLQQKSQARESTNRDFNFVQQDIAELERMQAQKTDTLNERKAWNEKEKMDAERKVREKDIASRGLPNETVYLLSIANSSEPGLPPAVKFIPAKKDDLGAAFMAIYPTNSINALQPLTNSISPDPMLEETKRIMQDYIHLQKSDVNTVATHE